MRMPCAMLTGQMSPLTNRASCHAQDAVPGVASTRLSTPLGLTTDRQSPSSTAASGVHTGISCMYASHLYLTDRMSGTPTACQGPQQAAAVRLQPSAESQCSRTPQILQCSFKAVPQQLDCRFNTFSIGCPTRANSPTLKVSIERSVSMIPALSTAQSMHDGLECIAAGDAIPDAIE